MAYIYIYIYIYIYVYIYPAANSSNSHTRNLSKFVDHYLPSLFTSICTTPTIVR